MFAIAIDRGDQIRKGHVALARDLLQAFPERVFEADTRLVASDNGGALDDRGFHVSCLRAFAVQSISPHRHPRASD